MTEKEPVDPQDDDISCLTPSTCDFSSQTDTTSNNKIAQTNVGLGIGGMVMGDEQGC